jgi:hypothetical protein
LFKSIIWLCAHWRTEFIILYQEVGDGGVGKEKGNKTLRLDKKAGTGQKRKFGLMYSTISCSAKAAN